MASTYSSDLKLELMATGENAGTWGDKTNTNLNLVQQAVAGFEQVTLSSGGTLALAMSDGAISNARNLVIKFATASIAASTVCTIPDSIEKFYIFGSFKISINDIFNGQLNDISKSVFYEIRLPRVIFAGFVGCALSLSGACLQGLFRNPLADPGLIGVSSGAALGAASIIVLGSNFIPDFLNLQYFDFLTSISIGFKYLICELSAIVLDLNVSIMLICSVCFFSFQRTPCDLYPFSWLKSALPFRLF